MSISSVRPKPREPAPPTAPDLRALRRSRRRFRIATIVLAILIGLPALTIMTVLLALNPIVRVKLEALAESALKVPVAIDHARVNLPGGVHLYHPAIGNPRPFKEVRAFRLERVDAAITLPSLFSSTIDVQDLLLVNPELILEFDGTRTNWGALFDNLAAAGREAPKGAGKKFIIRRVRMVHPVVIIRSTLIPQGAALHLRDIALESVGTAPGSETPTHLVLAAIFQALLTGAINEWSGVPGELSATLEKDVSRAARPFKEVLSPPKKKKK